MSYPNSVYNRFVREVEEAGFSWEEYRGRDFYQGPALFIEPEELQAAIRATSMALRWDLMGKTGLVVYPRT